MAEPSYKFTDRRGTGSGYSHFTCKSPGFVNAARSSAQREQFADADKDTSALMPATDRKRLMTIGRKLYASSPVVAGALNEMAALATAIVTPQFDGQDSEWGAKAEAWLYENDKWADVRGHPFDMASIDKLTVLHCFRDCDVGILLTEDESGTPKLQMISGHRIGSRGDTHLVELTTGRFKGRRMVDGVILGDSMETLGYQVLGNTMDMDRQYSVKDMRLMFVPVFSDQVRGFSLLGAAVEHVQDEHESRKLELLGQKVIAGRTVVEHNETGSVDPGTATILTTGSEATATTDATAPIYGRSMNGGETTYFRAGSNSKLEVLTGDRPTSNQQAFSATTIRLALHAIGWSTDFSLDPTKAGGASMRVVVERVNATLRGIRRDITGKMRKWVDPWRIAKAVNNGWLPESADWWRWEYQFAADHTADKKYDSDVDLQEMRAGISTQRDVCAKRGEWWEDVSRQKEIEARDRLTKAKKLAEEFGIPMSEAMNQLALLTPNGSTASQQQQSADPGDTAK